MAGVNKVCDCGTNFNASESEIRRGGGKFCSPDCYHDSRKGGRSTNWKGGRKTNSHGYIELYMPWHPMSDPQGYILEHRFVMAEYLGRPLSEDEIVHHKNEVRSDNPIENLELTTRPKHTSLHNKGVKKSAEHCRKISESKKSMSHLIERNDIGQFKRGVQYG